MINTGGAANGLIVRYGNVGIGTANPSQKLDVGSGNVYANNYWIGATGKWASQMAGGLKQDICYWTGYTEHSLGGVFCSAGYYGAGIECNANRTPGASSPNDADRCRLYCCRSY